MKPIFTDTQKNDLCYIIGDWYIQWKNNLIYSDTNTHRLDIACDCLIIDIKDLFAMKKLLISESQLKFITNQIIFWYEISKDTIVVCYEHKTHRLGQKKEILKLMVCDDIEESKNILDKYMKDDMLFKGDFISE